jgi:hypothetical protein
MADPAGVETEDCHGRDAQLLRAIVFRQKRRRADLRNSANYHPWKKDDRKHGIALNEDAPGTTA